MSKYTLSAKTLTGIESHFGVDELGKVCADDNVFYIGDVPYALDSIECVELAAAQARIAQLTRTIDSKNRVIDHWRHECDRHVDARTATEGRVQKLTAVLRPFVVWSADHLDRQEFGHSDVRVVYTINDKVITLGDMRRACAALTGQ